MGLFQNVYHQNELAMVVIIAIDAQGNISLEFKYGWYVSRFHEKQTHQNNQDL
jgi:hypothetical protein